MLLENKLGFYTFSSFLNFNNLVCTISTCKLGNMKPLRTSGGRVFSRKQQKFFKLLGLARPNIISAEQTHGSNVAILDGMTKEMMVKNCDGLVTKRKNIFLAIFVADCLPIFAYDSKKEIIGIAHAGWRGTLKGITGNLIKTFVKIGAEPKDILVGFGPGIEFCHYEVKKDVTHLFSDARMEKPLLKRVSGKFYLDLKNANVEQLIGQGILKSNIDTNLKVCTYETSDFYSYRRDKTSKRNAAIIGLKNE